MDETSRTSHRATEYERFYGEDGRYPKEANFRREMSVTSGSAPGLVAEDGNFTRLQYTAYRQ